MLSSEDAQKLVAEHGSVRKAAEAIGVAKSTFFDWMQAAPAETPVVVDDSGAPDRVLIIGDTHCPAMHPNYIEFLQETYDRFNCNRVVHIGDVVDWQSISYHRTPLTPTTPEVEYEHAKAQLADLYDAFPKAQVLGGNHDALPWRKAEDAGIPFSLINKPEQMWETPGWEWLPRYADLEIDGVIYRHGDKGRGGQQAALKNAQAEFCSVVQGHAHSQLGVWYHVNQHLRIFGMQTGCGVDPHSPAMAYGKIYSQRPALGCGVVLEGVDGIAVPMPLANKYK